MMVESLRAMRFFVAVYEERSFTLAAEREAATQSGVSQHIQKIEARLNVALFVRGRGVITPTPAGDLYYRHCVDILHRQADAAQSVAQFSRGLTGEIEVGLMPTITRCLLAPTLSRFIERHPNVTVRVLEAYSATLMTRVLAGEIAFAIVPAIPAPTGVILRPFVTSREMLVSGKARGLSHMAPLRLCEIGPVNLVLPTRRNARRPALDAYLTAYGRVERVLEMEAMMGTLDFVARTDWVTILPSVMMLREVGATRFTVNPLADPPLLTELVTAVAARYPLSPAARAFHDTLAEVTAEAVTREGLAFTG